MDRRSVPRLEGSASVTGEGEGVYAAQGWTGRRPHARPKAALPPAEPAALTQYRKSSPLPLRRRCGNDNGSCTLASSCRTTGEAIANGR